MALLHRAEITPSKLELLAAWLPSQGWYGEATSDGLDRVAACRFDDPDGEVGIELLLVRTGDGPVYHAPLTYRGAPLDGADGWLVGTTEHSVLGKRWVYDACGDPVFAAVLAGVVLGDTKQAEEYLEVDGRLEARPPSMRVDGTGGPGVTIGAVHRVVPGDPTVIETGAATLSVVRVLSPAAEAPTGTAPTGTLSGTWPGAPSPVLLAYAKNP